LFASMYQARSRRSVPTESIVPPVRISPTLGSKPAIRKTLRVAVLPYPEMKGRTFHFRGRKPHGIQYLGYARQRQIASCTGSKCDARCGLIMPDAAAPQRYRRGSLGWLEAKLLRGDG